MIDTDGLVITLDLSQNRENLWLNLEHSRESEVGIVLNLTTSNSSLFYVYNVLIVLIKVTRVCSVYIKKNIGDFLRNIGPAGLNRGKVSNLITTLGRIYGIKLSQKSNFYSLILPN
ncbi:hypothetical protein BpHYR1_019270 [Brachionus plicatilis]|uniref:Uncharacterized protein n=1 Tax=Brachionus plicatilis TaxID=10195 RepID=A0A3M7PFE4_BRAPC|nr:hypothetical protein BpHYR1_019270 [Brachionus plicatilis]